MRDLSEIRVFFDGGTSGSGSGRGRGGAAKKKVAAKKGKGKKGRLARKGAKK